MNEGENGPSKVPDKINQPNKEIDKKIDDYIKGCKESIRDNGLFTSFLRVAESLKGEHLYISQDDHMELAGKTIKIFETAAQKIMYENAGKKELLNVFLGLYDTFRIEKGEALVNGFGRDETVVKGAQDYYEERIKLFEDILKENGVEKIVVTAGSEFDPLKMSVLEEESGEDASKKVLQVVDSGFTFNENGKTEILRPTGVIISVPAMREEAEMTGEEIDKRDIDETFRECNKYDDKDLIKKFTPILESFKGDDRSNISSYDSEMVTNEALKAFGKVLGMDRSNRRAQLVEFLNLFDFLYITNNAVLKKKASSAVSSEEYDKAQGFYEKRIGMFEKLLEGEGVEKVELKGDKFEWKMMSTKDLEKADESKRGKVLEIKTPLFLIKNKETKKKEVLRKAGVVVGKW